MPDHPEWVLPSYTEPPHGPKSDQAEEYPLTCTTGRRIPVYFHSEHRQLPWCRELWPVPRVEINPVTAAEYGIEQGDWVWIETPYGKIRECADLYYGVDRNIINCEHTWWYPEVQDSGHGFQLSQVNQLIDRNAQDPHLRHLEPARLPGQDLQGDARELAVQQPGAVRLQRRRDHPHRHRPASEGMAAHLRREGVTHAESDHHRPQPLRRLPGLQRGLQGAERRADRRVLEPRRARGAEPRVRGRRLPRRLHVLPAGHLPALRDPECVHVCPTGASTKDEDGTIQIDKELCIGCGACLTPAPTACATSTPTRNVAEKCTMCQQTINEEGGVPQCVSQCGGNARWFGDIEEGYESFEGPEATACAASAAG